MEKAGLRHPGVLGKKGKSAHPGQFQSFDEGPFQHQYSLRAFLVSPPEPGRFLRLADALSRLPLTISDTVYEAQQDRDRRKNVNVAQMQQLVSLKGFAKRVKARAVSLVQAMHRRRKAKGLQSVYPYPLSFCVEALEQCEDDANRAAEWLMENEVELKARNLDEGKDKGEEKGGDDKGGGEVAAEDAWWACSMCTFMNESDFLACSMCGSEREIVPGGACAVKKEGEEEVAAAAAAAVGGGGKADWSCEMCASENDSSEMTCNVCGCECPDDVREAAEAATAKIAAAVAAAAAADGGGGGGEGGGKDGEGGGVLAAAVEDVGIRLDIAAQQKDLKLAEYPLSLFNIPADPRRGGDAEVFSALTNCCGTDECLDKRHKACIGPCRPCGHQCGGMRGEHVFPGAECLPCLECDLGISDELCGICFAEPLGKAPCIRLGCGHVFHEECLKTLISKLWTPPKVKKREGGGSIQMACAQEDTWERFCLILC
jgi:hypothetical protein